MVNWCRGARSVKRNDDEPSLLYCQKQFVEASTDYKNEVIRAVSVY